MSSRKSARWSLAVPNLRPQVSSGSPSSARRALRDIVIVIVVVLVFLNTSYWLINQYARYIYLAGGMCAAALAYLVSANWLKNTVVVVAAMSLLLMADEIYSDVMEKPSSGASVRASQRETLRYSEPLRSNGGPLGYAPLPNRVVKAWKTIGSDRVYDVTYTIDNYGLRVTPEDPGQCGAARRIFIRSAAPSP